MLADERCALIHYGHANFGPLADRGTRRFHIDLYSIPYSWT